MASPSLLHSSASSFHSQFPAGSTTQSIRLPYGNPSNRCSGFTVKASMGIVLVEKSEAEMANRLNTTYLEKIVPLLKEEFSYTNVHQVPKVKKIVVNCGIGDAAQNSKGLDAAVNDLALISGQRPVKTQAMQLPLSRLEKTSRLGLLSLLEGM